MTREAPQKVIDLRSCRRTERSARSTLRAVGNCAPLLQNILAHGETDPLLLFVTDERKMSIEQVVRGIALSVLSKLHNIRWILSEFALRPVIRSRM
jgi:hypothetical protein